MFMPYFSLVGIHLLITSFKALGLRGIAKKNANISQHSNLCVLFKSGTQTSHR